MDEDKRQPSVVVIGPADKLSGFVHGFWGKYVSGFRPEEHCQAGLLGPREKRVKQDMLIGKVLDLGKRAQTHEYFYVCGVTSRWKDNFHLAVRFEPEAVASAKTFNGFEVTILGARQLEIPPLPDGFAGVLKSYSTCRNWQFGVEYFGLPDDFVPPPPKPKKKKGKRGKASGGKTPDLTPGEREMRLANYVTQETDEDGDVYYLVPSDSSDAIHEVSVRFVGCDS
jgi:hypothetical protein